MAISISEGRPQVCPGRSPPFPPAEKDPYDWLRSFLPSGYSFVDVDGFPINFRTQHVTALFQKREFESNEPVSETELLEALQIHILSNRSDWQTRIKLSSIISIPIFVILWPKDYPYDGRSVENPVRFYELKGDLQLQQIQQGDVDTLRQFIKKYRAGYSPRYVKPLDSAYTKMECYLAQNTNDTWPGNLDGALLKNDEVEALIEFKTHNLSSPISGEDIKKYSDADGTRFFALKIMQSHLSEIQKKPTYLLIHWGPNHSQIKIQSINLTQVADEKILTIGDDRETRPREFASKTLAYLGI